MVKGLIPKGDNYKYKYIGLKWRFMLEPLEYETLANPTPVYNESRDVKNDESRFLESLETELNLIETKRSNDLNNSSVFGVHKNDVNVIKTSVKNIRGINGINTTRDVLTPKSSNRARARTPSSSKLAEGKPTLPPINNYVPHPSYMFRRDSNVSLCSMDSVSIEPIDDDISEKLNASMTKIKDLKIKDQFKKYVQENGYRVPGCIKESTRKKLAPVVVPNYSVPSASD